MGLNERIDSLPPEMQIEVANFVVYLHLKRARQNLDVLNQSCARPSCLPVGYRSRCLHPSRARDMGRLRLPAGVGQTLSDIVLPIFISDGRVNVTKILYNTSNHKGTLGVPSSNAPGIHAKATQGVIGVNMKPDLQALKPKYVNQRLDLNRLCNEINLEMGW